MSSSCFERQRRGAGSGLLFVIAGPSGAGKDTLIDGAMSRLPHLAHSISHTTRAPRPGEIDGTHYFFLSIERFLREIEENEFLEHAVYVGDHYGTSRTHVQSLIAEGNDVLLDIDVQGAAILREADLSGCQVVTVFVMPSTLAQLGERLRCRGSDSEEKIRRRLETAEEEVKRIPEYDYLVINNQLDDAVAEVCGIIVAERARVVRPTTACR